MTPADGPAPPDTDDHSPAALPLAEPFHESKAKLVDLLHDMGASERFCVDGESLIIEALAQSRLTAAGTPVSIIAQVENLLWLLTSITQHVAQFEVLFFTAYEPVWSAADPAAAASRAILISHLQGAGVPVLVFEGGWWAEPGGSLSAYLKRERPTFLLLSDAVATAGPDTQGAALPDCFHQVASLAGGLMISCLSQGTDVAYMSSLAFDPITVFGFLTSAERSSTWARRELRPCCEAAEDLLTHVASQSAPQPPLDASAAQLPQLVGQLCSWRLGAGVCSLAAAQQVPVGAADAWLSQVWLLHLVLLRTMPLEQRALKDLTSLASLQQQPGTGQLAQFINKTTGAVAALTSGFQDCLARCGDWAHAGTWRSGAGQPQQQANGGGSAAAPQASDIQTLLRAELTDTFDVRLFQSVLLLACAQRQECPLGLPPAAQQEWAAACTVLQQVTGSAAVAVGSTLQPAPAVVLDEVAGLLGGAAPGGLPGVLAHWQQQAAAPQRGQQLSVRDYDEAAGTRLLKESFVGSVLQQCKLGAPHVDTINAAADRPGEGTGVAGAVPPAYQPLFTRQSPYRETHHWHTKRELQPAFVAEATDDSEVLKQLLKQVDVVPLEELSNLSRIRRGKKFLIDRLVSQADEYKKNNPYDSRIHELQVQARQTARDSISDSMIRQKQMEARAMGRMIASLEGEAKFGASSRAPSKPGQARQATDGAGVKESSKAAAIRLANSQDKRKAALAEQLGLWATAEGKVVDWARSYSSAMGWSDPGAVQSACLAPIDAFLEAHRDLQPEVLQIALGTKLLVLFHAIRERIKLLATTTATATSTPSVTATGDTNGTHTTSDAPPPAAGAAASITSGPGQLDDAATLKLLVELMVVVQALKAQPPAALLTPVLEAAAAGKAGSSSAASSSSKKDKGASKGGVSKEEDKAGKDAGKGAAGSGASGAVRLPWQPERTTTALAAVIATLQALGFGVVSSHLTDEVVSRGLAAGAATGGADAGGKSAASGSGGGKAKGGAKAGKAAAGDSAAAQAAGGEPAAGSAGAVLKAAVAAMKLKAVPIGLCPVRFQLQHMHNLLERPVQGVQDLRVHGFRPDAWQQRLLDAVDKGSSAVISAPTSSGKTFIASYVIARVLNESEAGRCVIVLPTKALVNQLSAQVQKDFGPVFGIFTRDFRTNVDGCRVLITVPACLEILVLSPAWQEQMSRVRYLILDEVHCMNERGSGEVWERLMMAARCPILALSATIGNPTQFASWLQGVKQLSKAQDVARGCVLPSDNYEVHLIEHKERFNDLQYHVHVPATETLVEGDTRRYAVQPHALGPVWTAGGPATPAQQQQPDHEVLSLHPLGSVDLAAECTAPGPLTDMSLAPNEALQLYDALVNEAHTRSAAGAAEGAAVVPVLAGLKALDPSACLGPAADPPRGASRLVLLSRPAAKTWATKLCAHAATWCKSGPEGLAALLSVQRALCGDVTDRMEQYAGASGTLADTPHGLPVQLDHVAPLLMGLAQRGMLPALIFNFDRRSCEKYADRLVSELEAAEREYRDKFAKKLQTERDRLDVQAQAALAAASKRKQKGDEGEEDAASASQRSAPVKIIDGITFSTDESQPDPSFTFLSPSKMGSSLLSETIEGLAEVLGDDQQQFLLRALSRGIGVHHGGLHTRYRQAVEMLFRSKTLQVVIATGTLAYGIHMPCRSVVMAGDSIFLDALNFRQMSGRAGRRGLDTLGHCIFYHVPMHKVHRLRAAPLPQLRGQHLLSPTLTLRLLLLSRQLQDKQNASNKKITVGGASSPAECMLASIIQSSFLSDALASNATRLAPSGASSSSLQLDSVRQQLTHTFCMSMRLLMDARLVSKEGEPCGLAGLATHLFWTAPANLALTRLLSSGALHDLCIESSDTQGQQGSAAIERLMLVMAHLFMRQPLPSGGAAERMCERASGRSPSVVVLPPLPDGCNQVIQEYNQEVLSTSTRCIVAYAAGLMAAAGAEGAGALERMRAEDATLPLSRLQHTAPLAQAEGGTDNQGVGVVSLLVSPSSPCVLHVCASSPFSCLTGRGDTFDSVAEMTAAVKPRIQVSPIAIPVLELRNRHGQLQPLNAFAYDFLKHGTRQAIVEDNQIAEGDAWEMLRAIQGILGAVSVSLQLLLDQQGGGGDGGDEDDEYDEEERAGAGGCRGTRNNQPLTQAFKKLSETFTAKFAAFNSRRQG